jgi:hypothetical protein
LLFCSFAALLLLVLLSWLISLLLLLSLLRIYCFTDLRHLLSVGVAIHLQYHSIPTAPHHKPSPTSYSTHQLPRIHCFTDFRHWLLVGSAIFSPPQATETATALLPSYSTGPTILPRGLPAYFQQYISTTSNHTHQPRIHCFTDLRHLLSVGLANLPSHLLHSRIYCFTDLRHLLSVGVAIYLQSTANSPHLITNQLLLHIPLTNYRGFIASLTFGICCRSVCNFTAFQPKQIARFLQPS